MSVRQLPALGDVDAEDLRGARGAPHAVDDRPAVGFRPGAVDAEALLRSRKQKGPAALAGFGPPGGGKFENLSVFRSPVMAGLKLRNLGTPTEFAAKIANTTFDGVPIMTESMPEFGLKRPCAKESFSR